MNDTTRWEGWRSGPFCGFDTETDGVDPTGAHIITACVGIAQPGHGWRPHTIMLKPSRPIPDECTAIHGITTAQAEAEGLERKVGLQQIAGLLAAAQLTGAPVCGHNVVFDLTILDRELRRESLPGLDIDGLVIDTLVLDKVSDQFRKGSRRLVDVCAVHGITLTDAHSADADALAAARLAWQLCTLLPIKPGDRDVSTGMGLEFQAQAYGEQRRSFARYRARQGKPLPEPLNTDWPIQAVEPAQEVLVS